ncbi:MAG: hypothetical protein ACREOO_21170 [bacterium]
MRQRRLRKSVLAVASFFMIASVSAQSLTPEMVVALKTVSAVTIDPTGKNIAFLLRTPRAAEGETGSAYICFHRTASGSRIR